MVSNGLGLAHEPRSFRAFLAEAAGRLWLARPKTLAGHWYW